MGDVIYMAGRPRKETAETPLVPGARGPVTFFFDLASAETYLAAERVDRLFTDVEWVPVLADALHAGSAVSDATALDRMQSDAEARATTLRIPLVWPDDMPVSFRSAMRIAGYAAGQGRAAAFVLAASRLAFCGGYDLNDPDNLAEACAAASLSLDDALRAAGDRTLDGALEARGRRLLAQGADRLPVLKVGRTLFCGEERLPEAAAAVRGTATPSAGSVTRLRPPVLAPDAG